MGWREQITWKKRVEQRGRMPGLEVREVRKGEGHAWLPGHRGHPRYGPQTSASAPRGPVRNADPQAPPRPPEAETPGRGRVSRVAARLQGTQMPVQAPGRCCSPSGPVPIPREPRLWGSGGPPWASSQGALCRLGSPSPPPAPPARAHLEQSLALGPLVRRLVALDSGTSDFSTLSGTSSHLRLAG